MLAQSQALEISGTGLITGLPVTVRIAPAQSGQGIVFRTQTQAIPACLSSVVNSDRGVTLGAGGETVSIVEHFLAACSLVGLSDLDVWVEGPELPLLDGSAHAWVRHLREAFGSEVRRPEALTLKQAVFYRHSETIVLYALPAPRLIVTYAVDFQNHAPLRNRWARWDSRSDGVEAIAQAQTFGYVEELPVLQAKGLALGVTTQNTLGLTPDGGYTRALYQDDEPIYHKMLDLLGDLTLMGVNPLAIQAQVFAFNAGHGAHIAFAKRLARGLGA